MRQPAFLALALLVLTLPSTAPGQQPPPSRADVPMNIVRVPIHTAPDDPVGGAYGTWAAGATYKVSFHGDMTFVPVLGGDAPHNLPIRWQTTSLRIGATELFEPRVEVERWHSDFRYEYRHPAFVEAYDVRSDGVEQTFVLAARPATAGDLVVTGRVEGELSAPRLDAAHQSVVFADGDGNAVVRYGEAFARDAAGRRLPLRTEHRDGVVQLTVPADFVRDAVYPLVVDPLVTTASLASGPVIAGPDIAYDEINGDYMVVFSRLNSLVDADAFALLMNQDFSNNTVVFADVSSAWNSTEPAVAAASNPTKFAMAFTRLSSGLASLGAQVAVHVHDGGDFSLRTNVLAVLPPTGSHDWHPDIGGTQAGSNGKSVMLVSQREFTGTAEVSETRLSYIVARPIDVSGPVPVLGAEFNVSQAGAVFTFVDRERPSINQVARTPSPVETTWVVAFQETPVTGPPEPWYLVARKITSSGTESSGFWTPSATAGKTDHRYRPQIAGSAGRYGVAFEQTPANPAEPKPNYPYGTVVAFEPFDWDEGSAVVRYPQVNHYSSSARALRVGGCAFSRRTRSHWAFTTESAVAFGGTGTITGKWIHQREQCGRLHPGPAHRLLVAGVPRDGDFAKRKRRRDLPTQLLQHRFHQSVLEPGHDPGPDPHGTG